MAPVLAQMCFLRELQDGTYGLADVALMNDALAVRADNEDLMQERLEKKHVR